MRWLFALFILPALLLVGLFYAVTDGKPGLDRAVRVSLADLDRGRAIVDSLGLQHMHEGEVRQMTLSEADLDLGVNYLAHRFAPRATPGSASAHIELSRLLVRASLPLPGLPRFVNLELALAQGGEVLTPEALRVGRLPLPVGLASDLLTWGLARSARGQPYAADLAAARSLLNSAQISGQTLALRFTWHDAAVETMADSIVSHGVDEAVLAQYRQRLNQVDSHEFAVLLGAAFALAQERSGQHDPLIENRAALTTLAEKALGGRLLTHRGVVKPNRHTGLRLAGREDTSQHFSLSAFIAAMGSGGLSDLAGVYKELDDAKPGGSGFSFNDLAADRAGSRLGEACTHSRAAALKMQARLAGIRDSRVFLPAIDDLPEAISQAEFQRIYGGVDQSAYRRMLEQIDARIARVVLYRD
jgi:uncharacterized protein YfiM (DUF2279 family)